MKVESVLLDAFEAAGGAHHQLERFVPGRRFLLAQVRSPAGELLGGLASCCRDGVRSPPTDATEAARLISSNDPTAAAVGLATINAVLNHNASSEDGVDWLMAAGRDRHVAMIGRFPFIEDELRPAVGELSIFEIEPRPGEFGAQDIPSRLPVADVVAITATTILNHTLHGILEHRRKDAEVLLLGPSTPLTPALYPLGVSRLAGIVVRDVEKAAQDVESGVSFRQMRGTARVMLSVS